MRCKVFNVGVSLIFFATSICQAQTGSFSGKVLDSSTKKAIPFLNIFFANTMMGTTSDENGLFKIDNIPYGKYSLTVSGVGYKVISQPLEIKEALINREIFVDQEVKLLAEVVVKSRPSDFTKNYKVFKKYFLGKSSNASTCEIVNQDAIDLSYDDQQDILTATAQEPIEVVNKALGYKIYYVLQTFKLDNKKGLVIVSGIPRFENLKFTKSNQENRWHRHRDQSYFGSVNHFIRSLYFHKLKQNHFTIWEIKENKEVLFNEDSLFVKSSDSWVDFHGTLKVVFDQEAEEFGYSGPSRYFKPQTSYLQFGKNNLIIYKNGYFEDQLGIVISGYMGWEKMAEAVPTEYEPYAPLK